MRKKSIPLLLLYFLFVPFYVCSQTTEVIIWMDGHYPPYSYEENKQIKGIYIDIMRKISQRMPDYNITFKAAPWQRVKKEVENGTVIAFAPLYYHGYDWPYVWPYSLAIMAESVIAVCRNDILSKPRPNWPDDYLGLRIGNASGYDGYGGRAFRQHVKDGKITLVETKTVKQNIFMLLKGRIDCYMVERLTYRWMMKKLNNSSVFKSTPYKILESAVISTDDVYLGFTDRDKGKFTFKKDFQQKFNNEVYKMKKSGEIKQIATQYQP